MKSSKKRSQQNSYLKTTKKYNLFEICNKLTSYEIHGHKDKLLELLCFENLPGTQDTT